MNSLSSQCMTCGELSGTRCKANGYLQNSEQRSHESGYLFHARLCIRHPGRCAVTDGCGKAFACKQVKVTNSG
eukprot:1120462-Amphidinium_carterae.3